MHMADWDNLAGRLGQPLYVPASRVQPADGAHSDDDDDDDDDVSLRMLQHYVTRYTQKEPQNQDSLHNIAPLLRRFTTSLGQRDARNPQQGSWDSELEMERVD